MSDRYAWLDDWCPQCGAAPGGRCRERSLNKRRDPAPRLHLARGWRGRSCPTCKGAPDEVCQAPSGRGASRPHTAQLRRARTELARDEVWEQLEQRAAAAAVVPFSGRAGQGGKVGIVVLSGEEKDRLADVELSLGDPIAYALAAPIWGPLRLVRRAAVHLRGGRVDVG